jgi:hypothetical protein
MFNEEVRFSENIDFQYPMKQACLREIDSYCKDVPHGQARVIRWGACCLLLAGFSAAGLPYLQLQLAAISLGLLHGWLAASRICLAPRTVSRR